MRFFMNKREMSLINENFRQINEKLDKLAELTNKTKLQEYRIQQIEELLAEMKDNKRDTIWRVLTPLLSAIISVIIPFIVSGGLLSK